MTKPKEDTMKKEMNLGLVAALTAALALTAARANISDDRTRTQTEGTLAGRGHRRLVGRGYRRGGRRA